MTHCPVCRTKLDRSDQFFPPAVLLRCRPCKRFMIEGSGEWVPAGPDAMERLRQLAVPVLLAITEDDDPRWGS